MTNEQIRHLAEHSLGDAKEAAEKLSRLKGFSLNSLRGLIECVKWAVKRAEETGLKEGLDGSNKKKFAIAILFSVVKLPWWVPRSLAESVASAVIDVVVDALKDKF